MTPFNRQAMLVSAVFCVLSFESSCSDASLSSAVKFETPYQAILLSNGSVYFGKLEGWGTNHPVLTDVYYVVAKTDPNTKEVKNVLVKRGKEWHAPDRMYLNPSQVVFVEPVGKDSTVAQRIAEAAVQ